MRIEFGSLSFTEQRSLVEQALKRLLESTRGSARMVRPKHIAKAIALPLHPPHLSLIKHLLLTELRTVTVNGCKWKIVEVSDGKKGCKLLYSRLPA